MWKSDLPPSYEESRNHQYSHQHGMYPQPPGYGYPAYGVPPQPAMPYPSQPGTQPHTGMRQGPGFPASGFPSIIPTFLSSPIPNNSPNMGETDVFASAGVWESRSVRHAFIRKVYLILAAQLIVTVSIVAVFVFVHPVRLFVVQNPGVYWASIVLYLVTYLVLVCCEGPRRRFPLNLVLLAVFTLAMSYMTGTISSYYDTKAVFLALIITAVVCVIVTIFCFQTKISPLALASSLCLPWLYWSQESSQLSCSHSNMSKHDSFHRF
ncbi:protein lifeguard 3 isoform X3 [Alosa sapidissima]|uniref:protein lifeguard 3 isoform X3 n=1 Tax=Alosa sapidissima TaxID=34773 RepID=UPI001C09BD37|nr:protein lifeguard 3 isoform X3 [Alosa sapidissima]